MERWSGKVAIVTGASSGIGAVISRELVTHGLNVLGISNQEDRLKSLYQNLKNLKGKFHYLCCDVEKEQDILYAFAYVNEKFGGVDILVNNAGIIRESTFQNVKTEDLRAVLNVNVLAPAIFIRESLKSMRLRKNEAHIININSLVGINAATTMPINIYPASKFALRGMADTLKNELEWYKDNIRVTGIHPGLVNTEIYGDSVIFNKLKTKLPVVEPKDVVDCVIFALSAPPNVQLHEITVTGVPKK
ncbi:farnesol dehydrogenase [Microplitis demolitor]|uniref:farnesol dehydrogenase n=1 Tax=Microplitis demolitor TaxID=69319 RepID=UPI0004CDB2A7|nr:farnesol dehydrogenase [Microplitis demolitor]